MIFPQKQLNVDPILINLCLLWGSLWVWWGIITIGGEHPQIHKLGLINMGSEVAGFLDILAASSNLFVAESPSDHERSTPSSFVARKKLHHFRASCVTRLIGGGGEGWRLKRLLDGPRKDQTLYTITTETAFPKGLKFMNSGSEQ